MNFRRQVKFFSFLLFTLCAISAAAQKDTLRVMAYNVLYYGNGCQGPNGPLHGYMAQIVAYANPDILSMEKMGSIPVTRDDKYGTSPYGFADSVVTYALDVAYPGRYAHCPYTNEAHNTNMAVIFYDQRKLGFLSIVSSYVNITDFNTYKFYYKDANLSRTHDTTFLYIIPNHDLSGDENEQVRGTQITGVMENIKRHFTHLPNMIDMGDFNVRNSDESFYQILIAAQDTDFRFFDPPFFPDRKLTYPANWDHNGQYSSYFTTSTRESAVEPNSCGTGGGAKNWYDHIFLSSWIVNNTDYIRYIPNSYRTIGNDGQRYRIGVNNRNTHVNNSASANVIDALYHMSNKYPVMVDLEVTSNTAGKSVADPEIAGGVDKKKENVTIDEKISDVLVIRFPEDMDGQEVTVVLLDNDGNTRMSKTKTVKGLEMDVKCNVAPGSYTVKITGHHNIIAQATVTKN